MSGPPDGAPSSNWWGDRVWDLQRQVSEHQQQLAAHHEADQRLDRDLRALRDTMDKGFRDLKSTLEVQVGALRVEVRDLKPPPPPPRPYVDRDDKVDRWGDIPIRWLVILFAMLMVTAASIGFAIGAGVDHPAARILERAI